MAGFFGYGIRNNAPVLGYDVDNFFSAVPNERAADGKLEPRHFARKRNRIHHR